MANSWDEIAHTTLEETSEPIAADATNIAKFGAPSVAIVTAVLAGVLGDAGKLSLKSPSVVVAAAVIAAAVVLGVYLAFATDIHTRGIVAVARFDAIAAIVGKDAERLASDATARTRLEEALAANALLETQLQQSERARDSAQAQLDAREQREAEQTLQQALGDIRGAILRADAIPRG
jgi:hypothetical protein